MIATVLRTTLWLGVVDALAGATLVGFLYTPEANVLMLGVSTLLIVSPRVSRMSGCLTSSPVRSTFNLTVPRMTWASKSVSMSRSRCRTRRS